MSNHKRIGFLTQEEKHEKEERDTCILVIICLIIVAIVAFCAGIAVGSKNTQDKIYNEAVQAGVGIFETGTVETSNKFKWINKESKIVKGEK
jgi:flagellar basal body-associated protein FliL